MRIVIISRHRKGYLVSNNVYPIKDNKNYLPELWICSYQCRDVDFLKDLYKFLKKYFNNSINHDKFP